MKHFPILRSRRLTIQLRELSMGESITIAAMPGHLEEASCTAFLRKAVESVKGVSDPAHWTVQERTLAVCHYLASTLDDGPNFSLGDGHFSDYLDGEADAQAAIPMVELGELSGDVWTLRHLTGAMAESIERTAGDIDGVTGRLHWLLGGMACQMVRSGEDAPDAQSDEGLFDDWLRGRMAVMAGFPESDFSTLMSLYLQGRDKLHHLFRMEFSADGLVSVAKEGGAVDLPPARFPVHTCLSRMAHELR